jgi:thioredoxin 1
MTNIQKITSVDQFEKFLKESDKKTFMVDFWAEWCPPCRMMNPIIEQTADAQKEIVVAKVNVDDFPELSQKYNISSIPTIAFFKNGEELPQLRLIGAVPFKVLEQHILKV